MGERTKKSVADEFSDFVTKRTETKSESTTKTTVPNTKPVRKDGDRKSGDTESTGQPDGRRSAILDEYPPCAVYDKGELKELIITSSLINQLYFNSEYKENHGTHICPKKIFHTYLKGDVKAAPTDAMTKGKYFETGLLGSGIGGSKQEAPLLKNGKKPIDYIRIDQQIEMGEMVMAKYGMTKELVQIEKSVPIEYKKYSGIKFSLKSHADLVTPVHILGFDYPWVVVDTKLTVDLDSHFGEYSWAEPRYMNHNQGILYSFVFQLPFMYLVFDYRPKSGIPSHKPIPVITPYMKELSEQDLNVAKQRFFDLQMTVQGTIDKIIMWDAEGYPAEPEFDVCKKCPLNPLNGGMCKDAYLPQPV